MILRAKTGIFLIALPLLLVGTNRPAARAVTLYWDKDGNAANNNTTTGAGLGGTGTWDPSSLNWFNGSADAAWVSGSDAVFWGSTGTVTLGAAQNVNSVSFKTTGYVLQSSTLNLAGPIGVDTGLADSIVSTIAGSAGLVKNGSGALHLVGTSNSYTGGTTVNAGTLGFVSGSLGALPATPTVDVTINNGAAIRFNVDALTLNINHQILLGTGGGAINTNTFNDGIAGVISGSSLTKTSTGTLTLTNANTYTGGTTVSAGTLLVNNTSGSGTGTGAVSVSAGAVLSGTGTVLGDVMNSGTVAPGNAVGTLHLGGNYTQAASGTFSVELASVASHDELMLSGNASLAGTLAVSLTNGFAPQAGNTFEVMTATGFGGTTFTTKSLPALTGNLGWNVNYGATKVTLSVALAGDFNGNGVVDAADYVVWRNGLGTTYQQSDYDTWRAHFGQTAGAGSGASLSAVSTVPEPGTWLLLAICGAALLISCKRRRGSFILLR